MKIDYELFKFTAQEVCRSESFPLWVKVYFTTGNEGRNLYEIKFNTKTLGYIIEIPNPFPHRDRMDYRIEPPRKRTMSKKSSSMLKHIVKELENGYQ